MWVSSSFCHAPHFLWWTRNRWCRGKMLWHHSCSSRADIFTYSRNTLPNTTLLSSHSQQSPLPTSLHSDWLKHQFWQASTPPSSALTISGCWRASSTIRKSDIRPKSYLTWGGADRLVDKSRGWFMRIVPWSLLAAIDKVFIVVLVEHNVICIW